MSGGLDSTLIGVLLREQSATSYPLFIDYGQRAARREWATCRRVHEVLRLPPPYRMDVRGYGGAIKSGLTTTRLPVEAPFTPGRNMLFLLLGASYAFQCDADAVAIGLLSEKQALFPDQTTAFLRQAENALAVALGRKLRVVAPLIEFSKADVVALAKKKKIRGTYSCHAGTRVPCGHCVSCEEIRGI